MAQIKTLGDLKVFIAQITRKHRDYNRPLEEYLRSLLAVIHKNANAPMSADLLAQVLEEAFTTEPVSFDPAWFGYRAYFGWDYQHGRYVPNELIDMEVRAVKHGVSDFELVNDVIHFQVADLHRLAEKPPEQSNYTWTGEVWHNTSVFANLECGISGMIAHTNKDASLLKCDWAELAILLESGRLWE